jgi:hypothetical protein
MLALGSFDYWQHVLTTRPAPKAQLDRPYVQGPGRFLLTAQQPDLLGQRRVEAEMVRVRTACVREASAVLRGPPTR